MSPMPRKPNTACAHRGTWKVLDIPGPWRTNSRARLYAFVFFPERPMTAFSRPSLPPLMTMFAQKELESARPTRFGQLSILSRLRRESQRIAEPRLARIRRRFCADPQTRGSTRYLSEISIFPKEKSHSA